MNMREHLLPQQIDALKAGNLPEDEVIGMLTHIGECGHCADALAERYREEELLRLPPEFSRKVMETLGTDIQRTVKMIPPKQVPAGKITKNGSHRTISYSGKKNGVYELYAYSFRVGIAACIALMLLFSGTLNYGVAFGQSIHGDFAAVNKLTENLRGFSDRLIDFKVKTDLKEVL
ncbi:MAG: hypothetical protein K0R19_1907 [Bacillota bacterium]|nr:hypothetical protein [Bacillota bacterium]